jgi:hypothetical protein
MRWDQRIIKVSKISYIETYERIYPFRKFKQLDNDKAWILPKGVDSLVERMEKARLIGNYKVSDSIREFLNKGGLVVRNGKDWYPKLLEKEISAEKEFTSWLYTTLVSSGRNSEDAQKTKNYFDDLIKKEYDI